MSVKSYSTGTLTALIAAAALSCGTAQADPLFAFAAQPQPAPQYAPQYAPIQNRPRPTKTRSSIRGCSARSSTIPPARRPAPS